MIAIDDGQRFSANFKRFSDWEVRFFDCELSKQI